jgi:hypothetical protein
MLSALFTIAGWAQSLQIPDVIRSTKDQWQDVIDVSIFSQGLGTVVTGALPVLQLQKIENLLRRMKPCRSLFASLAVSEIYAALFWISLGPIKRDLHGPVSI